jgi:hypothetical protein
VGDTWAPCALLADPMWCSGRAPVPVTTLISIYDRATRAVGDEDRMQMFLTYIAKVEEYYGVTKTRDVFEKAIEVLPDKEVTCDRGPFPCASVSQGCG